MAAHLFITRRRIKQRIESKRRVLFTTTVKKGITHFKVQIVHNNHEQPFALHLSYCEAMRRTSNVLYIDWSVPEDDHEEFLADECSYLRRLVNVQLHQSRFNRSHLRLLVANSTEAYAVTSTGSGGLNKGQGSSDEHTSFPTLAKSATVGTLPHKANYRPNNSPVFFEDKEIQKQTAKVMLE